jgi:hypothetical protein
MDNRLSTVRNRDVRNFSDSSFPETNRRCGLQFIRDIHSHPQFFHNSSVRKALLRLVSRVSALLSTNFKRANLTVARVIPIRMIDNIF